MDIQKTQLLCGNIFFDSTVKEFSISCSFCEGIFQEMSMLVAHLVDHHYFSVNLMDLKREIEFYDVDDRELLVTKKEIPFEELDESDFSTNTSEDIDKEVSETKIKTFQNYYENSEIVKSEYSKIEIEVLCEKTDEEFLDFETKYEPPEEDYIGSESENQLKLEEDKILHDDLKASKLWKCNFCEKILKRVSKFSHLKQMHGGKKPVYQCPFCDVSFDSINKLWRHKNEHTGQDLHCFKCSECPKRFKSKGAVKDHHQRIHLRMSKYDCGYCDRKFYCSSEKKAHEVFMHNDEGRKVCDTCGERFVTTQRLNNHFRRKHSDVTYDCPICGKKFKLQSVLKDHLKKTHTNERLFECKPCGKSFKYIGSLRKHDVVVHVGERNCICKLCGKAFPTTSHVSCHMKTHGIPYSRDMVIFKKK